MAESNHPTGMISKHPVSELHFGNIEGPLKALGMQEVKENHPMGKTGGASKGTGSRNPKGMGRSVAKELIEKEKKKSY